MFTNFSIKPSVPNPVQRLRSGKGFSSLNPDIPQTSFSCNDQQYPGLYADPEAECQVNFNT